MSVARHFRRAGPAAPNTAAPNTATYETGAQVGSGGSSIVRRDAATPEFCTKVVRDPTLLAACVCEITLAMALSPHPNIIGFTGVEYADDYICIRMPWYGESLRTAIVRQRAGESQRAAAAIRGVMRGLRYMHSRGVVHCDIKPENIYVSDAGEGVIADFGSAMLAGSPPVYYELQTVLYRAPETVPGRPPAPAIDMWSLGVILAELGGYVHSVTAAKVHGDYVREVSAWAAAHSPALSTGLLSHNPADRAAAPVSNPVIPEIGGLALRERVDAAIRARLRPGVDYTYLSGSAPVALCITGGIPEMAPRDIKRACRLSCAAAGILLNQ